MKIKMVALISMNAYQANALFVPLVSTLPVHIDVRVMKDSNPVEKGEYIAVRGNYFIK